MQRKIRKLMRNPKLFFRDAAIKRGWLPAPIQTKAPVKPAPAPAPLPVVKRAAPAVQDPLRGLVPNYIVPHHQEQAVFEILLGLGINFYRVPTAWHHVLRIAIPDNAVEAVIKALNTARTFSYKLKIARGTQNFDLIHLRFYDDKYLYHNLSIQLDPWYITPLGIQTRHHNQLTQFIPRAEINRSVYSYMPFYLVQKNQLRHMQEFVQGSKALFQAGDREIDIVYTWVDDKDTRWQQKKAFYAPASSGQSPRYAEYEQLRYSLRSLASYCPFVRNIYIVTDDQKPHWLDLDHPKIRLIDHRDIFPDSSVLPVFNSVAIEANLHRIPGLSENFIYMNDDFFFGSPVSEQTFVHSNGIGKIFLESSPNAYGEILDDYEDTRKLSLYSAQVFLKKMGRNPFYWPLHVPMIKNREVMAEAEACFQEEWERTRRSRFRESETISPLYLVYSYYAYETGRAVQDSIPHRYLSTDDKNLEKSLQTLGTEIKEGRCKVFCINDHRTVEPKATMAVKTFLERTFPIPAPWELDD